MSTKCSRLSRPEIAVILLMLLFVVGLSLILSFVYCKDSSLGALAFHPKNLLDDIRQQQKWNTLRSSQGNVIINEDNYDSDADNLLICDCFADASKSDPTLHKHTISTRTDGSNNDTPDGTDGVDNANAVMEADAMVVADAETHLKRAFNLGNALGIQKSQATYCAKYCLYMEGEITPAFKPTSFSPGVILLIVSTNVSVIVLAGVFVWSKALKKVHESSLDDYTEHDSLGREKLSSPQIPTLCNFLDVELGDLMNPISQPRRFVDGGPCPGSPSRKSFSVK